MKSNAKRAAQMREQMAAARVKTSVPDDPDGGTPDNDDRADWAAAALVTFAEQTGSDLEDAVCDLIADLGHFCDRHGLSMFAEINRGKEHYEYETGDEGKQFEHFEAPVDCDNCGKANPKREASNWCPDCLASPAAQERP